MKFVIGLAALAASMPVLAQDHQQHGGAQASAVQANPTQAGQSAFAAIGEIVAILEADPKTDWSSVNIDALHDHLKDMNDVLLNTSVSRTNLPRGARFVVTGRDESAQKALSRMTVGHAGMPLDPDMQLSVNATQNGVVVTATSDSPAEVAKIRALGFYGLLSLSNHHQSHHLMLAQGKPMPTH